MHEKEPTEFALDESGAVQMPDAKQAQTGPGHGYFSSCEALAGGTRTLRGTFKIRRGCGRCFSKSRRRTAKHRRVPIRHSPSACLGCGRARTRTRRTETVPARVGACRRIPSHSRPAAASFARIRLRLSSAEGQFPLTEHPENDDARRSPIQPREVEDGVPEDVPEGVAESPIILMNPEGAGEAEQTQQVQSLEGMAELDSHRKSALRTDKGRHTTYHLEDGSSNTIR
jgi:hypothetical protein